mgnify:CR=1 FL=1
MSDRKIAIVASDKPEAQAAKATLEAAYKTVPVEDAQTMIALGGDGLMLQCLHKTMDNDQSIFGMHCGSVGFLMNSFSVKNLMERIEKAHLTKIHPLKMLAIDHQNNTHEALAINEVSLSRSTAQAAKLKIHVDGKVRMEELVCDGVLVATPAGSTAYNLSAHGPILPIEAQLMALTPISAFRPRRWRGALLPEKASVSIETLDNGKRPVDAVADHIAFRNVVKVDIAQDKTRNLNMLFDADHNLDERILNEQFLP